MKIHIVQYQGFLNSQGGTEKMATFFANTFSQKGHDVAIVTQDPVEGTSVFPLDPKVRLINLYKGKDKSIVLRKLYNYKGKNPFSWIRFKIQKKIDKAHNKRLMAAQGVRTMDELQIHNLNVRSKNWPSFFATEKPDIIISMAISTLLEITYHGPLPYPIINTVHGRPDYDYSDILWYRSSQDMDLLKKSYSYLTGIQVLFESYEAYLPDTFTGICKVIPNPIPQYDEGQFAKLDQVKDRYQLIHVGSLINAGKQQELAMECFAALKDKYPNWDLIFIGEGPDELYLKERSAALGLENSVFFRGYTAKPEEELRKADVFVFPSKYEGFPLSLGEAMSIGLPAIGFSTCSGVNELIQHQKTGFLAQDKNEFMYYLDQLMSDKELRIQMGREAHQYVQAFDKTMVAQKWEEYIHEIHEKHKHQN